MTGPRRIGSRQFVDAAATLYTRAAPARWLPAVAHPANARQRLRVAAQRRVHDVAHLTKTNRAHPRTVGADELALRGALAAERAARSRAAWRSAERARHVGLGVAVAPDAGPPAAARGLHDLLDALVAHAELGRDLAQRRAAEVQAAAPRASSTSSSATQRSQACSPSGVSQRLPIDKRSVVVEREGVAIRKRRSDFNDALWRQVTMDGK
jgi:hypothetical protein